MLPLSFGLTESHLQTVLCLGAHCDDIEIGCGGSLLELANRQEGLNVHWIVLSGKDTERERETRESARQLLGNRAKIEVTVMGFRDSYFPYLGGQIKEFLAARLTEIEPELIFTHHHADRHQDHRLVSELTWNLYRDHLILEYEIPKYDGDLSRPNVYFPVSEDNCEKKANVLVECHRSQTNRDWFATDTFKALMRLRGIECGSTTRYAEAFHGQKLKLFGG